MGRYLPAIVEISGMTQPLQMPVNSQYLEAWNRLVPYTTIAIDIFLEDSST